MTRLCAPVKQWVFLPGVDLMEVDEGRHKTLYDRSGKACFIDIDWKKPFPYTRIPVIVSYHDFDATSDLPAILHRLECAHPRARFYKIATFAHSTLDSLRMLRFLQAHRNVIGLCMGEWGSITRIAAPLFHTPLTYAPLSEKEKNAPGQLTANQLREIYHFSNHGPATKLFGLIGDPVHRSIGHLFHNDFFHQYNLPGLYLKMGVKASELGRFFQDIKNLPFQGLSVTAPLKEVILPFLDKIDPLAQHIGAVNTLIFQESQWVGFNTDGEAALGVLGDVKGKRIAVLGAGGAAKSIAYTAIKRGASVVIVNRTVEKARQAAAQFGCDWSQRVPSYDILVNATSASLPIDPQAILPKTRVMDIALYETQLLSEAQKRGCYCLNGFPLYFAQALAQQAIWRELWTHI